MAGTDNNSGMAPLQALETRRREMTVFLATTFVLIPGLTVAFVGAYGFAIWLSQLLIGPPGPPG